METIQGKYTVKTNPNKMQWAIPFRNKIPWFTISDCLPYPMQNFLVMQVYRISQSIAEGLSIHKHVELDKPPFYYNI